MLLKEKELANAKLYSDNKDKEIEDDSLNKEFIFIFILNGDKRNIM